MAKKPNVRICDTCKGSTLQKDGKKCVACKGRGYVVVSNI